MLLRTVPLRTVALAAPLLVLGALAAPGGARPASAGAVSPAQADHWGAFFGDAVRADQDRTLRPAGITFPDPSPIAQVGSSNSSQYALLADGTLWAWGQGTKGQLGDGGTSNSFTSPVRVTFPAGVTIAFIPTDAMPYDTALAVDTTGRAWGWGLNLNGELCLGKPQAYAAPQKLPFTAVTALAGADNHAVYDSGGTVYSCGSNYDGAGGTGVLNGPDNHRPVQVAALAGLTVTALVSSYDNAGALTAGGAYYDWGYDAAGQLGNGTVAQPSGTPAQVPLPGPVTAVAEGGSAASNGQTIVMLSGGSLLAWGDDSWAQLGTGTTAAAVPSPVPVTPPSGVTYATLASGGATSYAIDTAGNVWAWGRGSDGQIGDGRTATARVPVQADQGATVISSTANDVVAG